MAPRGGRGGGSRGGGGSSSNTCPGAFSGDNPYGTPVAFFVSYCLFFVVYLVILSQWFKIRKLAGNSPGRRLIGPFFITALGFAIIGSILIIIATLLLECETTPYWTYSNWAIAFNIFFRLSNYLLLVVVVYSVNDALRALHGNRPSYLKIFYGAVLGIMGLLTVAYLGLSSWNHWTNTNSGYYADALIDEETKLSLAYYVLYLVSVVAAGALAIVTIVSMRSKQGNANGLFAWIGSLVFAMFIWVLFNLVQIGASLESNYLGIQVYEAFEYLEDAFQCISYIIVLYLAKSAVFRSAVTANPETQQYDAPIYHSGPQQTTYAHAPPQQQQQQQQQQTTYAPVPIPQQQNTYAPAQAPYQQQQQYAYSQPNGAQYHHQQDQPVYNGTAPPMNGYGQPK